MAPQLEKPRTGVRVNGFDTVHSLVIGEPETFWPPLCIISTGSSDLIKPTNDPVTCGRCLRMLAAPPKLTKVQKVYLQGWRHGTKDDLKTGPANQKDEALRAAYLQGFEHGLNDLENAQHHGASL